MVRRVTWTEASRCRSTCGSFSSSSSSLCQNESKSTSVSHSDDARGEDERKNSLVDGCELGLSLVELSSCSVEVGLDVVEVVLELDDLALELDDLGLESSNLSGHEAMVDLDLCVQADGLQVSPSMGRVGRREGRRRAHLSSLIIRSPRTKVVVV